MGNGKWDVGCGTWDVKIEAKTFYICVLVLFLTETVASRIISGSGLVPMIMLGLIRVLEIILLIIVIQVWGNGLSSIGLGKSHILPGIKRGILWSLGFGVIVLIGFGIIFLCGINPLKIAHVSISKNSSEIFMLFLLGGLIAPIAEEIFFRGVLFSFLRQWGLLPALILSTLVFAFIHPVRGIPLTQLIGGILFAAAYEVEQKLMAPIIIHVMGNTAMFTLSLLV